MWISKTENDTPKHRTYYISMMQFVVRIQLREKGARARAKSHDKQTYTQIHLECMYHFLLCCGEHNNVLCVVCGWQSLSFRIFLQRCSLFFSSLLLFNIFVFLSFLFFLIGLLVGLCNSVNFVSPEGRTLNHLLKHDMHTQHRHWHAQRYKLKPSHMMHMCASEWRKTQSKRQRDS